MSIQFRTLWSAFIRTLIVVFFTILLCSLYLAFDPDALLSVILLFQIPGNVVIPDPVLTPLPPAIAVSRGEIPSGNLAYFGEINDDQFGCFFLMELEDGARVGVGAAHATPNLSGANSVQFITPDGQTAAMMKSLLARGHLFIRDHFTQDFVIWEVAEEFAASQFLKPDSRGYGVPGERVVVYGVARNGTGHSEGRTGVIIDVKPEALWIQLDESFSPGGFSGCPVISQHTGRVIGMAVAGENKPPVVMGLHPIGSLVEKTQAALSLP